MIKSVGIYKITSPTGRIYIGQSMNIEARFRGYKNLTNCKGQYKLYKSFVKYGTLNHKYEIIEYCEIEDLNNRERFWQEHYNCISSGLNCTLVSTSEKKMLLSDEVRAKMSLAGKGKKQSKEHVQNRVKSKKGYSHSEETKNKIAEKQNKLLLNVLTGIYYKNTLEAAQSLNMNLSTFQAMMCGRNKNRTFLIYA